MNRRNFLKNSAGLFVPAVFGIIPAKAEVLFRPWYANVPAASGGSKTPNQVTGLVGWWKFDAVSGADSSTQTSLSDSSGTGNNLTTGAGFTLRTGANGKNSLNIGQFDGATQQIGAATQSTYTSPFSVLVVFKSAVTSGNPIILWWGGGGIQIFPASTIDPQNPTDTTGPSVDTGWHIMCFVFNGASSKYRKDGGAWTSFSASPGTGSVTQMNMGAKSGVGFWQGNIGEVALWNNAISTTGGDGDAVITSEDSKWAVY